MSRTKKETQSSLFASTTLAPVAAAPSPVAAAPVVVAHDEPDATSIPPENVTRLRESYPFVERHTDGRYWVGHVHGERVGSSILFTKAELKELRTRIDAELAFQESMGV